MKNIMGIIHHYKNDGILREITNHRCMAAVPYGGRYRLVDFMLSNMVQAGICNIAVITSLHLRSLVDHLGKGREWGLDRKKDGLFILPCAEEGTVIKDHYVDLKDISFNLDYLERSRQKQVVISGSNLVLNLDLARAVKTHLEKKAQITVVYKEGYFPGEGEVSNYLCLRTGKDGRIKEFDADCFPGMNKKVSLGIYIMEKSLLLDLIADCHKENEWDLIKCGLMPNTAKIKMYGYSHPGYAAIINSLEGYFRHQRELLEPEVWRDLFNKERPILTRYKDGPPTMYCKGSEVKNSLLANSCVIEGKVENSILFRGVRIHKGAVVKNSILMQDTDVGEEAFLERVILDKHVYVSRGAMLTGNEETQLVIGKRSVI